MTEMLELVVMEILPSEWECPFPHEEMKFPDVKNDFLGSGKELGDCMEEGEQTIHPDVPEQYQDEKWAKSLRPFKPPARPIKLRGYTPPTLPLTCAAHHLIPAQASLRQVQEFAKYLFKDTAKFYKSRIDVDAKGKKSKVREPVDMGGGRLHENVGYNVNGIQNGTWLPGPYALRTKAVIAQVLKKAPQGRGGPGVTAHMKQQKVAFDPEDWVEGETEEEPKPFHYYFLYTVAAMKKVTAQYHDAHDDYSDFVSDALICMAVLFNQIDVWKGCDNSECGTRRRLKGKLPPPYKALRWLNDLSGRLETFLRGTPEAWRSPVLTSPWSLEYWKHREDDEILTLIDAG